MFINPTIYIIIIFMLASGMKFISFVYSQNIYMWTSYNFVVVSHRIIEYAVLEITHQDHWV